MNEQEWGAFKGDLEELGTKIHAVGLLIREVDRLREERNEAREFVSKFADWYLNGIHYIHYLEACNWVSRWQAEEST